MARNGSAWHRSPARTFALGLIAFLALFWSVVLVATWSAPHALFGWNLGFDGKTLTYIVPGGPASKVGLQKGDRIDWATLPLVARANLAIVEAVSPIHKSTSLFRIAGSNEPLASRRSRGHQSSRTHREP